MIDEAQIEHDRANAIPERGIRRICMGFMVGEQHQLMGRRKGIITPIELAGCDRSSACQILDLTDIEARALIGFAGPHNPLLAYLQVATCLPVSQVLVWSYRNTLGPSPSTGYKQNWQAILSFCGPEASALDCPLLTEQFAVQEINAPDGRLGNRYHTWQKPDELAERLIRHSTRPGDLVLDCFAGTGTFLLAAHRLGRVALGCERSPEMLALAARRGCEITEPRGDAA